jgi:hypothetical protein
MKFRVSFGSICLVLALFGVPSISAKFARYETIQVPIDRVLTNLHKQFAANTNNVRNLYQLARVYSMAYSTNLQSVHVNTNRYPGEPFTVVFSSPDEAEVPHELQTNRIQTAEARAHLTNAIIYYERAKSTKWNDTNRWLMLPVYLGHAWCLDQSDDREKAKEAYREALRYAWELEVERNYTIKDRMEWAWSRAITGQNPLSRIPPRGLGLGPCYSEEIIRYLLPLLDATKDAKEIAKLKDAQKTLKSMPRAVTPILVGLDAGLAFDSLVNRSAAVEFDLDGTGVPRKFQWITPNAAWLVYDHDGSGKITSGLQLFGNVTFWIFWKNGYDALASLDDDSNGLIEGAELRNLSLWRDVNSDGRSEAGEVRPVGDFGIVGLKTTALTGSNEFLSNSDGVLLRDGTSLPTFDWIAKTATQR